MVDITYYHPYLYPLLSKEGIEVRGNKLKQFIRSFEDIYNRIKNSVSMIICHTRFFLPSNVIFLLFTVFKLLLSTITTFLFNLIDSPMSALSFQVAIQLQKTTDLLTLP